MDECLHATDLVGININFGLVVKDEFFLQKRLPEAFFHLKALFCLNIHLTREKLVVVSSQFFCVPHSAVGMAHQLIGVLPVGGKNTDADAGGDNGGLSVDMSRFVDGMQDLLFYPMK